MVVEAPWHCGRTLVRLRGLPDVTGAWPREGNYRVTSVAVLTPPLGWLEGDMYMNIMINTNATAREIKLSF